MQFGLTHLARLVFAIWNHQGKVPRYLQRFVFYLYAGYIMRLNSIKFSGRNQVWILINNLWFKILNESEINKGSKRFILIRNYASQNNVGTLKLQGRWITILILPSLKG
jgi:hypothetical protein